MAGLSVIMPVFNGAVFFAEAAASVLRSPLVTELVVVDDGSTDETPALASSLDERVTYLRQENRGPAAARNVGLDVARGEIVGFIDADDLWSTGHPATALRRLQCGGAALVFGETRCISGAEPFGPRFHTFQLGSAICRRELFDKAGRFDKTMRVGEDLDWFLRVRACGASIVALPEMSLFYRVHAGNRARIYQSSRAGLLDALQRSMQRKREALATTS